MRSNKTLLKMCSSIIKKLILVCFLLVLVTGEALSQSAPQLGESSVADVVQAMTLKEKVQLVTGMGRKPPTVPGAAGQTHGVPRLGIPSLVLADGPAGVRIQPIRDDTSTTYYATAFPVGRLLASSWDTALVERVGENYGNEAHEYGVDIALAPALNIHRNPLGGRNFEYYSEDPIISGKITAAMVRGIQSEGVGTTIKHFVAYNEESNRRDINTIASQRALREIYLKGFEIAVKEAQPWAVMSSYNIVNGSYTSQRYDLLTTILRDEWGFKGFVMTDWTSGDSVVEQMEAGNDMIMPGTKEEMEQLVNAVRSGALDEAILDKNVSRILHIVLKTPSFKKYEYSNNPDLKAHAKVARKAAAESIILLENNNQTLPLNKKDKIVAFGNTSYNIIIGGTGSGEVNEAYSVQLMKGLMDAGYTTDKDMAKAYRNYMEETRAKDSKSEHQNPTSEMPLGVKKIREKAKENDVAIITIGRNAGEGADRAVSDFYLTKREKSLINKVSKAFHAKDKKVVIILNTDGMIDVASWKDQADAVLLAWQPGQEAGHSIADILSGNVNPSGRLTTTIPVDYEDVPSSEYFPGTPEDKPEQVVYKEGIYNGYRYYDSFDVKPAYEFGFGLSYTQFSFGETQISSPKFVSNKVTLTTTVTNSGEDAGKEVIQLYISPPKMAIDRPTKELNSFAKTKLLEPGESQKITFEINSEDLALFNPEKSAWEVPKGTYNIKIGASSRDIRATKLLDVAQNITVEKVDDVLQPKEEIDEIKPSSNQ